MVEVSEKEQHTYPGRGLNGSQGAFVRFYG